MIFYLLKHRLTCGERDRYAGLLLSSSLDSDCCPLQRQMFSLDLWPHTCSHTATNSSEDWCYLEDSNQDLDVDSGDAKRQAEHGGEHDEEQNHEDPQLENQQEHTPRVRHGCRREVNSSSADSRLMFTHAAFTCGSDVPVLFRMDFWSRLHYHCLRSAAPPLTMRIWLFLTLH